jgi:Family of unknown function (DUF5694)
MNMRGPMHKLALTFAVLTLSSICIAQSAERPEILVLGAYHMANPGADAFNMQADDVLSAKRQQEILQLIAVLKTFRPTKIAIEEDVGSKTTEREYSDYVAGNYALDRGEDDQIGYRLAKELGHKKVYPVDVDGDFPLDRVSKWAKSNGRAAEIDAMMSSFGTQIKEEGAFLHSHTVLEMLEYLNSDEAADRAVASYYDCVPFGSPTDFVGPDLLAAWYQRNIRIYHNIFKLIESRDERILVIFGAGHLGWLRQDINSDSTVRLRKLADLIK